GTQLPPDDLVVPTGSDCSPNWAKLTDCWFHTLCHIPRETDEPVIDQPTEGPPVIHSSPPPSDTGSAQAQQVPEPSALLLVGLGSLGLACFRRRHKRTSPPAYPGRARAPLALLCLSRPESS